MKLSGSRMYQYPVQKAPPNSAGKRTLLEGPMWRSDLVLFWLLRFSKNDTSGPSTITNALFAMRLWVVQLSESSRQDLHAFGYGCSFQDGRFKFGLCSVKECQTSTRFLSYHIYLIKRASLIFSASITHWTQTAGVIQNLIVAR